MLKVGDRVRFKTWAAMRKRYGTCTGDIDCRHGFVSSMKHLCGTHATISYIDDDGNVDLKDFEATESTDWCYSTDMIVRAK